MGRAAYRPLILAAASPVTAQLTLSQAVDDALRNYPAIEISQEQLNAAAAGIRLARTGYLPRIDTAAQWNRATRNNVFGLLLPQSVIPSMSGPDPAQMEGYLTYYYEYHFLYITGIDSIDSKSIQGAALMKLVFHEGTNIRMRGEIPPLEQTLSGLRVGLLLAVLVIFLLLAANFQSIRLALAIIFTIPAVLCGVVLMLLATGATLNVQSFMGAIMAMGIAVANSILLVTFAERARHDGRPLLEAVREAASSRLRAILMTASAMICGMLPMAIEGPLGRAVIGGLLVATFATLTILPSIYAIIQTNDPVTSPSLNPMDPESRYHDAQ